MNPALFKYTYLLLMVILVPKLKGQSTYDSIRSVLPNHPDSAYNLAFQWNSYFVEDTPYSIVGKSLYLLGLASYYKSEFYLAEDFFLKAIEKFDIYESSLLIEAYYNNIGICREMSGRLDESIESYLKSQSIAEDRKNSLGMMQTNINIGLLNLKINRIKEGKEILKDAKRFFEYNMDSFNLALIYQNLAKAADLEGDIQSFIDFSNQAL